MDSIDRLKLAIYESGLSEEDQEALLTYVKEVTIDGDILKTQLGITSKGILATAGISGSYKGAKLYTLTAKQKKQKDRLKELCDQLSRENEPAKQQQIESMIDKLQKDIDNTEKKIGRTKKDLRKAINTVGVGAAGLAISSRIPEKDIHIGKNNKSKTRAYKYNMDDEWDGPEIVRRSDLKKEK